MSGHMFPVPPISAAAASVALPGAVNARAEQLAPAATATAPARASAAQVGRAVFWSFVGIRRRDGHEIDVARITPVQAIIAGLIGAALFVTSLVILVNILTAK